MKILFTTTAPNIMRFFESVVAELAERGHEVTIARHLPASRSKEDVTSEHLAATYPNVTHTTVPAPEEVMHPFALALRSGRDYLQFLDPAFNPSYRLRAEKRLPRRSRQLLSPLGASPALRRAASSSLRTMSEAVPVDPNLQAYLAETRPDVVLMSPYMGLRTVHPDFARAAQSLGIPAVACVASWDNLTTKSRVWPAPDTTIVWNEWQRKEAVEIHGLPSASIEVTGAQVFDQWFERTPRPREEFLGRVGLDPARPMVVYMCSSPFRDAPDELPFVRRWIEAVRASGDPALAEASILVRPHPKRQEQWDGVDLHEYEHVSVWPPRGELVVGEAASADYFDSMHHSAAVIGLNTSAMIEAGIIGRPVHTVLVPEFEGSQHGTFHFRYLVEVGGGLVRVAKDLDQHLGLLAQSVARAGEDDAAAEDFVRDFVRPHGLDRPATPIFADAVERIAREGRGPDGVVPGGRPRDRALQPVLLVAAHGRTRYAEARRKRRRARKRRLKAEAR